MTNEEAILYWNNLRKTFEENEQNEQNPFAKQHYRTSIEAIDAAIKALESLGNDTNVPTNTAKIDREAWEPCNKCISCENCSFDSREVEEEPCSTCINGPMNSFLEFKPEKYCRFCGRPLTEEAWAKLEKRLRGVRK
nr:MAG TPA: Rad50 zinc hook motif [Caudoviricetes sp.]